MKKITVMNETAKATYEKGINDTNWTLKFFDGNGNAHTWDRAQECIEIIQQDMTGDIEIYPAGGKNNGL